MNWRGFLDENESKYDVIRTILNYILFESFLKNFQLRMIETCSNKIVFGVRFTEETELIY